MNAKIRTVMTLVVALLIPGLSPFEQSTLAQSARSRFGSRTNSAQTTKEQSTAEQSARDNCLCLSLKGKTVQVFDPATGVVSGPVTNAGFLNGTLEDVLDADFAFTPDPNVVTFLSDLTITTAHGQLKASRLVTAFNTATGFWMEFGEINPDTSTGRFAGATGVIFFSGKTIGNLATGPYEARITGEICLAK